MPTTRKSSRKMRSTRRKRGGAMAFAARGPLRGMYAAAPRPAGEHPQYGAPFLRGNERRVSSIAELDWISPQSERYEVRKPISVEGLVLSTLDAERAKDFVFGNYDVYAIRSDPAAGGTPADRSVQAEATAEGLGRKHHFLSHAEVRRLQEARAAAEAAGTPEAEARAAFAERVRRGNFEPPGARQLAVAPR